MIVTLLQIQQAAQLIKEKIKPTPLLRDIKLNDDQKYKLHLKAEVFQTMGSFKLRGVLNKLSTLNEEEKKNGVITISAGNHAQSLAYAAHSEGVESLVVMPPSAPAVKVANTRKYGAEVIHADSTELLDVMMKLKEERGMTLVHPFDDVDVIAGAGSIGLEILDQSPKVPDVVLVPIGGGGLISGVAAAIKEGYPSTKIIGVEPEGACAMYKSLEQDKVVTLDSLNTVADGLAAPFAGKVTYEHVKKYVDEIVLVSDEAILEAVRSLAIDHKLVAEPGGAATVAALMSGVYVPDRGSTVVTIISGGNIDQQLLSSSVAP